MAHPPASSRATPTSSSRRDRAGGAGRGGAGGRTPAPPVARRTQLRRPGERHTPGRRRTGGANPAQRRARGAPVRPRSPSDRTGGRHGHGCARSSGVYRPAQPRVHGARLRVSGDDRLRHHHRRDRPLARTSRCPGMVRISAGTGFVRHGAAVHGTPRRSRPEPTRRAVGGALARTVPVRGGNRGRGDTHAGALRAQHFQPLPERSLPGARLPVAQTGRSPDTEPLTAAAAPRAQAGSGDLLVHPSLRHHVS